MWKSPSKIRVRIGRYAYTFGLTLDPRNLLVGVTWDTKFPKPDPLCVNGKICPLPGIFLEVSRLRLPLPKRGPFYALPWVYVYKRDPFHARPTERTESAGQDQGESSEVV